MGFLSLETGAYHGCASKLVFISFFFFKQKTAYEIPLTKAVCDNVSTPVIASSGCGSPEHMSEVFTEADADAGLAASIFHFDEYSIEEVKQDLRDDGIPVRL